MRHFDDVFINNLEGSFPLFIGSLHIGTPEVTTGDRWCALAIGLNSRDLLHIHRNDRNSACTSAWRFFWYSFLLNETKRMKLQSGNCWIWGCVWKPLLALKKAPSAQKLLRFLIQQACASSGTVRANTFSVAICSPYLLRSLLASTSPQPRRV